MVILALIVKSANRVSGIQHAILVASFLKQASFRVESSIVQTSLIVRGRPLSHIPFSTLISRLARLVVQ